MSSDGTVIPGRPRGSNPFPFDSALCDVMSRIGIPPDRMAEFESFWWFLMEEGWPSPDDVASAIMAVLPPETDEQANKRRSLIRMGIADVTTTNHEKVKVKRKHK